MWEEEVIKREKQEETVERQTDIAWFFFMWNPNLAHVYVEKERVGGQWGEHEPNAMRCLKTSVMARTLRKN